jgi:hypothetical protein
MRNIWFIFHSEYMSEVPPGVIKTRRFLGRINGAFQRNESLEHDAIEINIRVLALDRTIAPALDCPVLRYARVSRRAWLENGCKMGRSLCAITSYGRC